MATVKLGLLISSKPLEGLADILLPAADYLGKACILNLWRDNGQLASFHLKRLLNGATGRRIVMG
jgi:hypothetical protein